MLFTSLSITQRKAPPLLPIAPMLLRLFGRAPEAALPIAEEVGTLEDAPDVSMYASDGSGTLTVAPGGFAPGQTGVGLTFSYTVPAGGLWLGELSLTVPDGWTLPIVSEADWDRGSVTANTGAVSVSGQMITVADLTLGAGRTVTITYSNVTVGRTRGSVCFKAEQRSTRFGLLKPLGVSPSVMVGSPGHGSRTLM